jgi:hypothetical protein
MVEPKKPVLGYLLYKYLGIETKSYKQYWKKYCEYMDYQFILTKKSL